MRNKRILKLIILGFLIILILKDCVDRTSNANQQWSEPVTVHHIVRTVAVSSAWVRENAFVNNDNFQSRMVAGQGVVAFLGGISIDDRSTITVLNAQSGELVWSTEYGKPSAILVSGSALYLGQNGGVNIYKFDLNTGDLKWEAPLVGTRGLVYLSSLGEKVFVQTTANTDKFFVLDANSGDVISSLQGGAIFSIFGRVVYQRSVISNSIEAADSSSGLILWTTKLNSRLTMLPVFTESSIFIRTDTGAVYCMERDTGIIKWSLEDIAISNLAVSDSLVFFLTFDGRLLGVNVVDGEKVLSVQFDGDGFSYNGGYNVAYDSLTDQIYVHLSDSAQLFALKIH